MAHWWQIPPVFSLARTQQTGVMSVDQTHK